MTYGPFKVGGPPVQDGGGFFAPLRLWGLSGLRSRRACRFLVGVSPMEVSHLPIKLHSESLHVYRLMVARWGLLASVLGARSTSGARPPLMTR
jgi:hypothetical protein